MLARCSKRALVPEVALPDSQGFWVCRASGLLRLYAAKAEGALEENCQHRPVQYLNNVLEQNHRAIKRRVKASQHFRSFWAAWRTIGGYEAIHMIHKGQACWSAAGAKVGLLHHFILGLFAATS
jgi:hypothetical protein